MEVGFTFQWRGGGGIFQRGGGLFNRGAPHVVALVLIGG